jgi:hypothetical protein
MFAGLPGIGVGTLFYVLIALWMPVREIGFLVTGRSSWARWRLIVTQLVFATCIIASVAAADRLLVYLLGVNQPQATGPARWLNDELGTRVPESVLAAPIVASVLLLCGVLLAVQVARLVMTLAHGRLATPTLRLDPEDGPVLDGN